MGQTDTGACHTPVTELGLSERQKKAVRYVKENGRITNTEYQNVAEVLKRESSRDLADLVEKDVFIKKGTHGKGVHYVLDQRGLT
jgi:ATP-dependent DNA helicase RecG